MIFNSLTSEKLAEIIKRGGVGVIPTDTIYGLVGRGLSEEVVEKIYKLKKRAPTKPMIILIGSIKDLQLFKIKVDEKTEKTLNDFWPGQVSIVLPCPHEKFSYLHRGTKTLAFRLPNYPELIALLEKTGPLIAPSANPEGKEPAETIGEAKKYFGNKVDFYVNRGKLKSPPSTLIKIQNGEIKILRQGAVKVS